jgi:hypothetical protein
MQRNSYEIGIVLNKKPITSYNPKVFFILPSQLNRHFSIV